MLSHLCLGDLGVTSDQSPAPAPRDPAPVFGGDWLMRLFDLGVDYTHLLAWLRQHRLLTVATDLALPRFDEETERQHLARLARQVLLGDPDNADPYAMAARSIFYGADLDPAVMMHLVSSPIRGDRLVLVLRDRPGVAVLAALVRDPDPMVRELLIERRDVDAAILSLFAVADHAETDLHVWDALVSHPLTPDHVLDRDPFAARRAAG